ncbi:MAG: MBL fold metallo-hydrolase [Candidatus Omnitrophica bacterium]|nr:MBL fold metallo-hydrolase [Candidatus Omnitrophota bacterium]
MEAARLTVVYDNEAFDPKMESGWGFSCYVEFAGKKVLFDTGDNPLKLSRNLACLGLDPRELDALVFSHEHWDHTGGLGAVLEKNPECPVYIGKNFSAGFKKKILDQGVRFHEVDEAVPLSQNLHLGPEMHRLGPWEIPMVLELPQGLVVITGCAHPGIEGMIKTVKKIFKKEVFLIVGGFHFFASIGIKKKVEAIRRTGVRKAAPCHCTGARAIRIFEELYGSDFIRVGSGLKIDLGRL